MDKAKQVGRLVALSLLLISGTAQASWSDINMPEGVTAISHNVYELHMIIFAVCVVIGIIVFGAMIISMMIHRKSLGHEPADFHDNTRIEILWTIIPIIILVVMAIPATKTLDAMYNSGKPDLRIKVEGYQWKWQYTYMNKDPAKVVKFMSNLKTPQDEIDNKAPKREHYLRDVDNPLVIPVNKRVEFLITSNDVIHSWWVPDFAIKKDAIPGFINTAWTVVDKPGMYRGQCAELCGKGHGFMPINVKAVSQADYDKWIGEKRKAAEAEYEIVGKTWTRDELMKKGDEVYHSICATCHQPNGQGLPPAFPALAGSPIATGPIKDHINIVLHGKAGTAMQAFGQQLNAAEIASVITYERNSFGNHTGDMVQPSEIDKLMKAGQ